MSRWFRMYDDVINDPKVMRLDPALRWHWVGVLCVASKGGGVVPAAGDVAFALRMGEGEAVAILASLVSAGLLDRREDGELIPHNWGDRQYQSDSSAERMRRHRDKQRAAKASVGDVAGDGTGDGTGDGACDVTCDDRRDVTGDEGGDVTETFQNRTEAETEKKELSRSIVADRPARGPSRFDEFWKAYPRREGANPRKPAETKFDALVRTGLDPQTLIDGARKLAGDETARGNIGTRYVPQAVTWLNQQRWSDHAAVAALQAIEGGGMTVEQALAQFARFGVWSRHAPCPEPGTLGCTIPADVLAKYGIAPDGSRSRPGEAA